jgi:hypothetical protein
MISSSKQGFKGEVGQIFQKTLAPVCLDSVHVFQHIIRGRPVKMEGKAPHIVNSEQKSLKRNSMPSHQVLEDTPRELSRIHLSLGKGFFLRQMLYCAKIGIPMRVALIPMNTAGTMVRPLPVKTTSHLVSVIHNSSTR